MIRLIRPLIQKSSSSISVVSLITLSGSTKAGNSPDLISLYPIIGSSHLTQYLRETGVDGSPENCGYNVTINQKRLKNIIKRH